MAIENINVLSGATVHKLIVSNRSEGQISNLILCWNVRGQFDGRDLINNAHWHSNINFVNCPVCLEVWRNGIYG